MKYLFPLSPWNQQRQFEKPAWVYPAHLAMYATHLRDRGHEILWGLTVDKVDRVIYDDTQINIPFENLPFPDRTLTDAKNPRWQAYGNYKFHPATHYMSSNLCWWAGAKGCIFCVDSRKIIGGEKRGVRSVAHVMSEIENCVSLGFKEMFDDAGTIPINDWLEELCEQMILSGLSKRIVLGCNMKPIRQNFSLMREAGFRFILVGVESANQSTIDKIQKGQHCEKVIENIKSMSDAGLEPHVTSMFGYPWETHEDEMRTVRLVQFLLRKGYAKTAQASVYSPPRTQPDPLSTGHKYIPMIYNAYMHPEFWLNKLKSVRKWEDVTYMARGGRLILEEKIRKLCIRKK
jgi:radical SAM superfamily enzyme YgiQ (UPF0313 family)